MLSSKSWVSVSNPILRTEKDVALQNAASFFLVYTRFRTPVSVFTFQFSVFTFPLQSPLPHRYHSDGILMFPYRLLRVFLCKKSADIPARTSHICRFLHFRFHLLSHQVVALTISDDEHLTMDEQFLYLFFAIGEDIIQRVLYIRFDEELVPNIR